MSNMTIDEATYKRVRAEEQIMYILSELQKDTGMFVREVNTVSTTLSADDGRILDRIIKVDIVLAV